MGKAHRSGSYQRDAAQVRRIAYADASTRCARCGLTLAEKPGDSWDAGHPEGLDGVAGAPLRPEHSSCNRSAGGKLGSKRRKARRLNLRHDY